MSERGVFAVDRGIWSDPDFPNEPFSEREAFLWLVGEAAWRPTKVRVGSRIVELERGQCSFSTRFMAAKFQWSEARVRRFLQRRSDLNQLCTKTDAGATQITICKYDAFQRVGLPSDAPATQERRTSDAKKKQGNKETDTSEAIASSVSRPARGTRVDGFQPDEAVGVEIGLSPEQSHREAEKFRDYFLGAPGQKGVKQDWPATWRNWARRAFENLPKHQTQRGPHEQHRPHSARPSFSEQVREGVRRANADRGVREPVQSRDQGRGADWPADERAGGMASRTFSFERGADGTFEDREHYPRRYADARH